MHESEGYESSNVHQVLSPLQLGEFQALFETNWALSQPSFSQAKLDFLTPEFIADTCRSVNVSCEVRGILVDALKLFDRHPGLRRLAWHCHCLLFHSGSEFDDEVKSWPQLPDSLGEGAALFYAIVLMSGMPLTQKRQCKQGIPEAVTVATLADFELWIRDHRKRHGHWGFSNTLWLLNHLRGTLYKLGRLQFEIRHYDFGYRAYYRPATRRTVVLAREGMRFAGDGQCDQDTTEHHQESAWTAELTIGPKTVAGNPVSPCGQALPKTVKLPTSEWREILHPGDSVLAIHIDASGPMDHTNCGDSLEYAMRFFPRYFPDTSIRAFTCDSWLLDPQLEKVLPKSSNIVRFLREFYLLPLPGANSDQTFDRVLGTQEPDIDQAPQETSLQRAVLGHVRAGGTWRNAGGLLFPETLDWGSAIYRQQPDIYSISQK